MLDYYYTCKLAVCTMESTVFRLRKTRLQKEHNYYKTKEMLIGPLLKLSIPPLVINYNPIERVCGFKLLGVYISDDLSWNLHVDYHNSLFRTDRS